MQKIIYILLAIFGSILVYFAVYLVMTHINITKKNNKKQRIKDKILKTLENKENIFAIKNFKNKESIDVISNLLNELPKKDKKNLIGLLKENNYDEYIEKIIKIKKVNEEMIFYIKVAGDLKMNNLSNRIIEIMKKNPENIDLQYHCLLALSKFGDKDILNKALNMDYKIKLTSRALQEILTEYTSDHKELYKELLKSKDLYIVRITILMIGENKVEELTQEVKKYLKSDDMNISLSAIKVLGRLNCVDSLDDILNLYNSKYWQVRSAAIKYAAKLDLDKSLKTLEIALTDKEWWVRLNAAKSIAKHKDRDKILARLKKKNDKYAIEILTFAIQKQKLYGGEKND